MPALCGTCPSRIAGQTGLGLRHPLLWSNDSEGKGVVDGACVPSILKQHPSSSSLDGPSEGSWKDGLVCLGDKSENLPFSLWRGKLEETQDCPLKVPASLVTVKTDYPALWLWVDPSSLQNSISHMYDGCQFCDSDECRGSELPTLSQCGCMHRTERLYLPGPERIGRAY